MKSAKNRIRRSVALTISFALLAGVAVAPATATEPGVEYSTTGIEIVNIGGTGKAVAVSSTGIVVGESDGEAFAYDLTTGTTTMLDFLPGGSWSWATAVNDAGLVVGGAEDASSDWLAFTYDLNGEDGMTVIAPFDGFDETEAEAVNAEGIVVGGAFSWDDNFGRSFFYYAGAATPTVEDIVGAESQSWATDVNDHGVVVGYVYDGNAFAYDVGTAHLSDLGNLGMDSKANAVSNSGIVVGESRDSDGRWKAFAYDLNASEPMKNLGDLVPYGTSFARAVNEAGVVVGEALATFAPTQTYRAFAYDLNASDGMRDLGVLDGPFDANSDALAVSEAGVVVGFSGVTHSYERAFAYDLSADTPEMIDLGTLGGIQSRANAVAEVEALDGRTVVVGWAQDGTGVRRPVAWILGGPEFPPIDLTPIGKQVALLDTEVGVEGDWWSALSGDGTTAVIAAPGHRKVWVFSSVNGDWAEAAMEAGDAGSAFGESVAISEDGSVIVVGDPNPVEGPGAAYVFRRDGAEWQLEQRLTATGGLRDDFFGSGVAISKEGGTILVGAPSVNTGTTAYPTGAAYVFTFDAEATEDPWSQTERLDDGLGSDDWAGDAVALNADGTVAVVGTWNDKALVYRKTDGVWSYWHTLTDDTEEEEPWFATTENTLAINDAGDLVVAGTHASWYGSPRDGNVFAYRLDDTSTSRVEVPRPDGASPSWGAAVAVNGAGDRIVVGDTDFHYGRRGMAFAYDYDADDDVWSLYARMASDGHEWWNAFGTTVGLSTDGTTVFAGGLTRGWIVELGTESADPPDAPGNVVAEATSTTSATVTWNEPADHGGSPPLRYVVTATDDTTTLPAVARYPDDPRSVAFTGLTPGATYTFGVVATNLAGDSLPGTDQLTMAPPAVPGVPTGLEATPGDGEVGLAWTAPADGGSPITGYTVAYKTSASEIWVTVPNVTTTSATVPWLDNGVEYEFKVLATNAVGDGVYSGVVTATPMAPPAVSVTIDSVKVKGATVEVFFTVEGAYSTIKCWLNDDLYLGDCDSATQNTFTLVPQGPNTVFVRADTVTDWRNVVVKSGKVKTGPDLPGDELTVTITSATAEENGPITVEFTATGGDDDTYEFTCLATGMSAPEGCESPWVYGDPGELSGGKYEITVTVEDAAGGAAIATTAVRVPRPKKK